MSKDLHKTPFDENTKVKLSLFRDYLRDWLPVFTGIRKIYDAVNIFDFFAGPGKDLMNEPGSPSIIMDMISKNRKYLSINKLKVNIYLNEFNHRKFQLLKKMISDENYSYVKIEMYNLDFEDAYKKLRSKMRNSANLLFLDQNGIKHITKEIFLDIIEHKATDFLFFISSSTINRFFDVDDIKKYVDTSKIKIERGDHYNVHRAVLNYYKSLIPTDKKYYLAPFSIKKDSNIYGLIFGSGHLLGIYKFLSLAWKKDPLRGEANFDIDREKLIHGQESLFEGGNKPHKLKLFEEELEEKILSKVLKTDKEVVEYTLTNGFISKHAKAIFTKMISENKIPKQKISFSNRGMYNPYYEHKNIIHNV